MNNIALFLLVPMSLVGVSTVSAFTDGPLVKRGVAMTDHKEDHKCKKDSLKEYFECRKEDQRFAIELKLSSDGGGGDSAHGAQ